MPNANLPQYTFAPWIRRGIGARITERDRLGDSVTGEVERARVQVALTVDYTPKAGAAVRPVIDKEVHLVGPGEIIGLKADAILRREPAPSTNTFPANALAYVDFFEEDLPWRYTPARAANPLEPEESRHKLRPWMSLLVLSEDEYSLDEGARPLPILSILAEHRNTALPREDETWAWAHVQLNEHLQDVADAGEAITARPESSLSRIVSPRRLERRTRYGAFLVPTFETGRRKGLGLPIEGIDAQAPAWRAGAMPHSPEMANQFPVYSWWRFATGDNGDFETLVRILVPGPAGPEFGRRRLDVSRPGYGLDGVAPASPIELEGALRPPSFQRIAFPQSPGPAFATAIEELVDLTENLGRAGAAVSAHPYFDAADANGYPASVPDDPIITPPAYGAAHAGVRRLADARSDVDLAWLRELNTDPRNRAVASAGAEVVRVRQEELMARAWAQLDEVEAAQQKMREAELAATVSQRMFQKHVALAPDDRLLTLTSAMQPRLLIEDRTVNAQFVASRVPGASRSPAFKRASRPQRKLMRRLTGTGNVSGIQDQLIARMNGEGALSPLSAAPPAPVPSTAVSLLQVTDAVGSALVELAGVEKPERFLFMDLVVSDLRGRLLRTPPQDLDVLPAATLRTALETALAARIPATATGPLAEERTRVLELINGITDVATDGPERALVTVNNAAFVATYGADISGKFSRGVTIAPVTPPAGAEVARMSNLQEIAQLGDDLTAFDDALGTRPTVPPRPALSDSPTLASSVRIALAPRAAIAARVQATLSTVAPAQGHRIFAPVRAHPEIDDAMFEDLRKQSQDFILPNFADLPENSLTVLVSNQRFIEAYMAGLNYEMSRELRWREYPTDLRGTYFSRFWDTHDDLSGANSRDIQDMHTWTGELGASSGRAGGFLVLAVRGDLLKAYPNTIVFAQRAAFTTTTGPRELAADTPENVLYPAFQGRLEPDIALFGFQLEEAAAKGTRPTDAGWFFVFQERPGELRFGLDDPLGAPPALPLAAWKDLNWGHLVSAAASPKHISVKEQPAALGLATPTVEDPSWRRSSADLASILLQSPILYARHAEEMLP
jgi:hypothetical protein